MAYIVIFIYLFGKQTCQVTNSAKNELVITCASREGAKSSRRQLGVTEAMSQWQWQRQPVLRPARMYEFNDNSRRVLQQLQTQQHEELWISSRLAVNWKMLRITAPIHNTKLFCSRVSQRCYHLLRGQHLVKYAGDFHLLKNQTHTHTREGAPGVFTLLVLINMALVLTNPEFKYAIILLVVSGIFQHAFKSPNILPSLVRVVTHWYDDSSLVS